MTLRSPLRQALAKTALLAAGALAALAQALAANPPVITYHEEEVAATRVGEVEPRRPGLRALPRPLRPGEGPVLAPRMAMAAADEGGVPRAVPQKRLDGALPRRSAHASLLGPRFEVRTGWESVRLGTGTNAQQADGVLYGVSGGYDLPLAAVRGGSVFAGLFASADLSTASLSVPAGGVTAELTQMRDLEIGARAGWSNERFALYALAALTNVRRLARTEAGGIAVEADLYDDGLRIGAGAEIALPARSYAKAEYRYAAYAEDDESHQLVTGLGLRF